MKRKQKDERNIVSWTSVHVDFNIFLSQMHKICEEVGWYVVGYLERLLDIAQLANMEL